MLLAASEEAGTLALGLCRLIQGRRATHCANRSRESRNRSWHCAWDCTGAREALGGISVAEPETLLCRGLLPQVMRRLHRRGTGSSVRRADIGRWRLRVSTGPNGELGTMFWVRGNTPGLLRDGRRCGCSLWRGRPLRRHDIGH